MPARVIMAQLAISIAIMCIGALILGQVVTGEASSDVELANAPRDTAASLPQLSAEPPVSPATSQPPIYVTWESESGFNNQRQALEVALTVAACLGPRTRLATHDWIASSKHSSFAHSSANNSAAAATHSHKSGLRTVLTKRRGSTPFELVTEPSVLADAALLLGDVDVVPWHSVPRSARVVSLQMSAFCSYSCSWVRRAVERSLPFDVRLAERPTRRAPAHSGVLAKSAGIFDDDAARAAAQVASDEAPFDFGERALAAYADEDDDDDGGAVESERADFAHLSATTYADYGNPAHFDEIGGDDRSEHAIAGTQHDTDTEAVSVESGDADARPIIIVPRTAWGISEVLFSRWPRTPFGAVRASERIQRLASALHALLDDASPQRRYAATHVRLGDAAPYALVNCRNLGAFLRRHAAHADSGVRSGMLANVSSAEYVRAFVGAGVACRSVETGRLLLVSDLLASMRYRVSGCEQLFVATNIPSAVEIASMRVDASALGVTLRTLDDLLALPEANETARALVALEREAGDAALVRSLLEQELCVRAEAYVACSLSTWDQYVLRERAILAAEHASASRNDAAVTKRALPAEAVASALADYALYVQRLRAGLATFKCKNEPRPSNTLATITFMLVACIVTPLVRAAYARLQTLEEEARSLAMRAKATSGPEDYEPEGALLSSLAKNQQPHMLSSTTLVLYDDAETDLNRAMTQYRRSGASRPSAATRASAAEGARELALARTLRFARILLGVHSFTMMLFEPLANAAHYGGPQGTPGAPDLVALFGMLRIFCLLALSSCVLYGICVLTLRWRAALSVCIAAWAFVLYVFSRSTLVAGDLLTTLPTEFILGRLALCTLVASAQLAILVLAAQRREYAARTNATIGSSWASVFTSAGDYVNRNALVLHIVCTLFALAIRLAYLVQDFWVDDALDIARTSLEVASAVLAAYVLVRGRDMLQFSVIELESDYADPVYAKYKD